MDSIRDVGRMGEKRLEEWCAQRSIPAHKSDPDRKGWDFILELSVTKEHPLFQSFSVGPEVINCLVQVKSTDTRWGWRRSLELRKWRNLATNESPAFFLILEYDGQSDPCRGFLVHLDEINRKKFLKAEAKCQSSLVLSYTKDEKLRELNGKGLEEAIRGHIGRDPEEYSAKKSTSIRNTGFENGIGTINFNFRAARDPLEHLIDTSIGLQRDPLPIDLGPVRFSPVRFGITSPNPITLPGGSGLLSASSTESAGATAVRFLSTPPLTLVTETFLPSRPLIADNQDKIKLRLVAPFIELICTWESGAKSLLKLSLPEPEKKVSIESLGKVSELYRILENAITTGEEVAAKIEILGKVTSGALLMPAERPDPGTMEIAQTVNDAWRLSKRFGFPREVAVTVAQLMSQKQLLSLVRRVIFDEAVPAKIHGTVDQLDRELPIYVPYVICIMIGEYCLRIAAIFWFDLAGLDFVEEDGSTRIEGTTSDVRLKKSDLYLACNRPPSGASEILEEISREYDDEATSLIMPRQVLGCD